MSYVDAVRENVWLRMMLMGPTGAGKTKGALEVATNLFGGELQVCAIDSEHERMKLYADRRAAYEDAALADSTRYRFKHWVLTDHTPEAWIAAMDQFAQDFPGGVLILDSASHEWMGKGGILQQADRFGDWKTVRPLHNSFVEAILSLPMHVIVCVRSKMKYSVDEYEDGGRTRQRISKLGLGPIQDDQFPYEFDVVASIDVGTHEATFSNRCDELVDKTLSLVPGGPVAEILTKWLSEGEPPPEPERAADDAVAELVASLRVEGFDEERIEAGLRAARAGNRGALHPDYVKENLAKSKRRLKAKEGKPAETQAPAA